jgi:hypothetical protein
MIFQLYNKSIMGCCEAKIDLDHEVLPPLDNLHLHDIGLIRTEEQFSDLSLDSHDEGNDRMIETSHTQMADSLVYYTRSTSISLHRTDLEVAFLQSLGLVRQNTLDLSREKKPKNS